MSEQESRVRIRRERDRLRSGDTFRYQSFIENSVDGTWRLDLEEPIALHLPVMEQVELLYRGAYFGYANQALAEQYGFDTPEAMIGFRMEEYLPRDDPTSASILVQAVKARYRLNNLESVERDKLGNRKVFLNNIIGEIEDGYLLRVWGSTSDITLRKRLEEEVRLRSEVFQQFQEGCLIVDRDSETIVLMNEAFTEITGHVKFNSPVDKLSFLQGPDTDAETAEKIRESIVREQACSCEMLSYKKDGTPFWSFLRIFPFRDVKGKPVHYAAIISDISEHKRARDDLCEKRAELAHVARVAVMGELAGALAHELSQPLTAVLSNAQAALRFLERDDCDLGEVREILKDIVADDKRAGQIVQRIRRTIKREDRESERVDVNTVVKDVHTLVKGDLVNRQVRFSATLAGNLPAVQGDQVQLQQVVLNLVMNACQAVGGREPGDRHIEVSTEEKKGCAVEITVKDSGNGIGEDLMDRILEAFFTTRSEGLGMGLAVSRTIVESHNGRLWAENSVDGGAVFHVTLPVVRCAGQQ